MGEACPQALVTSVFGKGSLVEISCGNPRVTCDHDCSGSRSGPQFHLLFLTDFSDRIGKTKRTGYESGEYEMVCCVCVLMGVCSDPV